MKIKQFLERLKGVIQTGTNQYQALCPAHADNNASLSIGIGDNGGIMLRCHAGCDTVDVLDAMGLTLQDIAAPDIYFPMAEYHYYDRDGNHVATKVRKEDSQCKKKFHWRTPDGTFKQPKVPLFYNIQMVSTRNDIIIVEGEKDADRLTGHGLVAVSQPNGAGKRWDNNFDSDFAGKNVYIVPDNDLTGIRTAHDIAAQLQSIANTVKVLELHMIWPEVPGHGDFSDMADALGDKDALMRLTQLSQTAPVWEPSAAAESLGSVIPPPVVPNSSQSSSPPPPITAQIAPDDDWDAPDLIDGFTPGEFPVESFPPWLREYVIALTAFAETPLELAALLVLGALATASQDKYTIWGGWREQLSLYTVAAANSGERKSAVVDGITAPILAYENQVKINERAEIARNRADLELLDARLKRAMSSAGKGDDAAKADAYMYREQIDNYKIKYPKRLLVNDATPEKLVAMLDEQGGCITIASAEGGLFTDMLGRYTGSPNVDVYLKGHSGDMIRVDRKTSGSNAIDTPRMSTIIATQPPVVHDFFGNKMLRDKGMCARFLCVICKPRAGYRPNINTPIPSNIQSQYAEILTQKLSAPYSGDLWLSKDALDIRKQYSDFVEPKFRSEWAHMADFGSKFVGAMLRIAGLLHVASIDTDPTAVEVSADTILAAIKISDYLALHAEQVYALAGVDPQINDAKFLLKRILDMTKISGQETITKRDLFDSHKSRYGKVSAMEPSLKILQDMGYIRLNDIRTGGRPSVQIEVNPKV